MKQITGLALLVGLLANGACMTVPPTSESAADVVASSAETIEPCLLAVMATMEGDWSFEAFVVGMTGGYRTIQLQSSHERTDTNTWRSTVLSDEDPEVSHEQVVGNQIIEIIDGNPDTDRARTFITCEGPNAVGRILTTSSYRLPIDEAGTEFVTFQNFATYSKAGNHFTEDIINEDGEVIAYRAGVSTPIPEDEETQSS